MAAPSAARSSPSATTPRRGYSGVARLVVKTRRSCSRRCRRRSPACCSSGTPACTPRWARLRVHRDHRRRARRGRARRRPRLGRRRRRRCVRPRGALHPAQLRRRPVDLAGRGPGRHHHHRRGLLAVTFRARRGGRAKERVPAPTPAAKEQHAEPASAHHPHHPCPRRRGRTTNKEEK